jgi:hypothetical protein
MSRKKRNKKNKGGSGGNASKQKSTKTKGGISPVGSVNDALVNEAIETIASDMNAALLRELRSMMDNTVAQPDTIRAQTISDYICKKIDNLAFSGPGNSLNKEDYHAWCVDDVGSICDYEPEELMTNVEYGTMDIVRRPFTAHEVSKWIVTCDAAYDAYMQASANRYGTMKKAQEMMLAAIKESRFPLKNCYIRAKVLYESDPKKYSLVIGSLGFKQEDGRIHWEYG